MLPQGLCTLVAIIGSIKNREGCGELLVRLVFVLVYPLVVPAGSIYWAAKELFWGENEEEILTTMKGFKMFEHLG